MLLSRPRRCEHSTYKGRLWLLPFGRSERRDHLLSRYAKRIARELERDAAQLDMAPPEDKAAHQASAQAKSVLNLLTGCCKADLNRQDSKSRAEQSKAGRTA